MNINSFKRDILKNGCKKAMPVLSFPAIKLLNVSVSELIQDSALQAKGMIEISKRTSTLACVSMMDLSVEAEAFGSTIRKSNDEVPTVVGRIISSSQEADSLIVPDVLSGRTALYIKAIEKAAEVITDRPVLAGVIGPFSLAGRLMDMSEIMVNCYTEPDMVNTTLEKTSEFILKYILEFKKAGANGVVMAEPAAGLLSPSLAEEFSSRYVKSICDKVKGDNFMFVYHNCGPNTPLMLDSLLQIGADIYHFGDAVDIKQILSAVPQDVLISGNISPSKQFRGGTPTSIYNATKNLLNECAMHKNFIISSGCDIPPLSDWENIDSFFKAVSDFYE